jgi:hypothetical protein
VRLWRGPTGPPGGTVVRKGLAAWVTLALIVVFTAGLAVGLANNRDETVMTVQVSSSDHELLEGYFSLGENATVMAKPGSELYKFLSRQRGRKVKITMTDAASPELSRIDR